MVIASQWRVDSEQTKELMSAFHRNRTENRMSSVESLRQAQLALLDRKGSRRFTGQRFLCSVVTGVTEADLGVTVGAALRGRPTVACEGLTILMIRVCPKCGDYYAGEALLFCLADGAPLVNVDPNDAAWSIGTRVVEEKARVVRKAQRRLQLRRVFMTMMTMVVTTSVMFVVAVNAFIYLKPASDTPSSSTMPSSTASIPSSEIPQECYCHYLQNHY